MYKTYTAMREDGTTKAMTIDYYQRKYMELDRRKNVSIVRTITHLLFDEIYKLQLLFDVQGVWYSPKMAPTMVHDQVFHIII